ncbi:uncharacterized protein LOC111051772 isoform X2 [Nilaparvata lugens]|uniref:uncharacterized protein LOC111051772 isoform X2 n=1 Tax=Nilaparvata lugens TaxID=108931 RepID=UPI00193E7052|nr:uncharacterized protein LOC111051772 isoform X2 [Nilaparvata lugens]
MGNNNKESYELLARFTSDSESEIPEVLIPTKKKKFRRKRRVNASQKNDMITVGKFCSCKGPGSKLLVAFMTCSVLFVWVIALTWLAYVLNAEIQRLDRTVQSVVAGNQGVPDTLQKCHSISRELQKNQTELFNRITALSQQIAAFNTQVSVVSSGLNKVEKQLKASPELVNVASLSSSVASFGSQIQDLVSTTKQLKETNTRLDETSHALELNITSLKQKVSEMKSTSISPTEVPDSNALASLSSLVNSLRSNLTNINNTLSSKLQWSSEDELRDSKLIQSLRDMTANLSARVTTLESKSIRKT